MALAFAKVSICYFYLRILPNRVVRIAVYSTIGFAAAYSFAGFLVIIFLCNPVVAARDPRPSGFSQYYLSTTQRIT